MPDNYIRIQAPPSRRAPIQPEHSHLKETPGLHSGLLRITLTALRPLHVGTGDLVPPALLDPRPDNPRSYPLIAPFMREENRYIIPGSSLKGTVRSLFEAMTFSCMATAGSRPPRRAPGDDLVRCGTGRAARNSFCPACRVFGGLGYMGRVFFDQAETAGQVEGEVIEAPQPWTPEIGKGHLRSRKVYTPGPSSYDAVEPIECLPADTQLRFDLHFRNLTDVELGLLLLALGQGPDRFALKIGARKAHDFGDVAVEITEAWGIVPDTLLNYSHAYSDLSGTLEQCIRAALEDADIFYREGYEALVAALKGA